jgi:hypothetical protein
MKATSTTKEILFDLEETLKTAKYGLDDLLEGVPNRKFSGLRNLVVFGRAVTNVLQKLRSTEPDFDTWYKPFQEEMKNDPLMKHFYKIRSEILKEGKLKVYRRVSFTFSEKNMARFGAPPKGWTSFFVADQYGGSGWKVKLPDGTIEKFYVSMPSDICEITTYFYEPPQEHLGTNLNDTSIENLSSYYYEYLKSLVEKAKIKYNV